MGKSVDRSKEVTYEVEKLVDVRGSGKKKEYLVKWVGYSSKDNTWEPLSHLSAVQDVSASPAHCHCCPKMSSCVKSTHNHGCWSSLGCGRVRKVVEEQGGGKSCCHPEAGAEDKSCDGAAEIVAKSEGIDASTGAERSPTAL